MPGHRLDEPGIDLDCDEWVEWGGDLIWAAGFTSGGAPYGLSLEEYRHRAGERLAGALCRAETDG